MNRKKGTLFVLSGPSGVGKGTVLSDFFKNYAENIYLSVSATSRLPREGEKEGINYYYKTKDEFEQMIKNDEFLEYASFCSNYYGTPEKPVDERIEKGEDVILEIEVQGALKVMEKRPDATFVFIAPPSFEELEKRIRLRNTETEEAIQKRLNQAKWELSVMEKYSYIVINDYIEKASKDIHYIVCAERLKTNKNINYINEVQKK